MASRRGSQEAAETPASAARTRRRRANQQASQWAGDTRETAIDGMFASARDAARISLGRDDITIGTETEKILVGLPLPSLALRYLFQSTIFPLSRVIQFAGPQGSCKSAMLYELFRWHCIYGGGACLAECENKDAAMMRNAILQRNPMWLGRIMTGPADSLQQWQSFLTMNFAHLRTNMDAVNGPGRTVPICMGVDSLTAVDTDEMIAKTATDGHASLGYAIQANLITRYMRQAIVPNLRNWPFTVAGTNHLKPKMAERSMPGMPPGKKSPGGEAINFMATFLIEMERIKDINVAEYSGLRIKFRMAKNNLGAPRKTIEAELLWWQCGLSDGEYQQEFVWDWDTAAIELLLRFKAQTGQATLFSRLMEIVDLHTASGKRVWSRTLGIPSSDPVPYRIAGQMLEQRPDILLAIYPHLGINRYSYFQPGMDYRTTVAQSAAAGVHEATMLYQNRENLPTLVAEDTPSEVTVEDESDE